MLQFYQSHKGQPMLACLMPRTPPPETHGQLILEGRSIPYTLRRSPRRRRSIAYHVLPGERVVVTAPLRARLEDCLKLLTQRATWVVTHFLKPPPPAQPTFTHGTTIPYKGKNLTLKVIVAPGPQRVTQRGSMLTVHARTATPAHLSKLIVPWLRTQALSHFEKRVALWATRMKLHPRTIRIGTAQRRWGSCSGTNTLNFTYRLIFAPPNLIDYVIVHELCHIPHKHHGKAFWALVATTLPDYKHRHTTLNHLGRTFPT